VRKALKHVIDKANNPDEDDEQETPEKERVKLPSIRFHDLRHSAATLLKTAGADLHTIKGLLGHSQIAITANLYAHTAPPVMRDAADRMQSIFETPTKPAEQAPR
jgi:integrase